jgi:hypothetical protein
LEPGHGALACCLGPGNKLVAKNITMYWLWGEAIARVGVWIKGVSTCEHTVERACEAVHASGVGEVRVGQSGADKVSRMSLWCALAVVGQCVNGDGEKGGQGMVGDGRA